MPHKGLGYGVLRYLADPAVRQAMAALPTAPITFNYLGQFDQSFADALFQPLGPAHRADPRRAGAVAQRAERRWPGLRRRAGAALDPCRERYDARTVNELAQAYLAELQALIEHCLEDAPAA
ncbi:hypothetical protein P4233_11185 [Pseudomonas aeruginosa]|nr:hypothetical protein [Pseudomonas aeruginosa]